MSEKIIINPDHIEMADFVRAVSERGIPADAEIIYKGRRNQIYKVKAGKRWVAIKAFRIPNMINTIAYSTVRKSKARRSYEHGLRLLENGILTPAPIAYIEHHRGPTLRRSYYICDYVDAPTVRNWEERADADDMLSALAENMVKMHRHGIWFKDFSPGNILAQGDPQHGYRFYYVDINRMKFDVYDSKFLLRNFRCINLDMEQTLRLARHYAMAAGLDQEAICQRAAAELNYYFHHKGAQDAVKKFLKVGKYSRKRAKQLSKSS